MRGFWTKTLTHTGFLMLSGLGMSAVFALLWTLPMHSVGKNMLAFQLAFTPDRAKQVLDLWGPGGAQSYLQFIWLDYLFPLGYGLFFTSCMAILGQKTGIGRQRFFRTMLWLPLLAAGFDYLENSMHIVILSRSVLEQPGWVFSAASAASIKWVMSLAALMYIIFLIFKGLFQFIRGGNKR